ncbi:MAG: hypothetical protein L0Y44_04755 [Phycisphaerales bacterium]|nr:hypothetical protein [Phycisphaerales bacterium]MCI0629947.1 hypothetical protein [Phycisphaerales bacterium]MCI0675364.1 hypothetical protein [Phycisphaerales bacterium]
MDEWIRLTDEELEALNPGESSESERGVAVHVFMAPYDLPQAVRGRYDELRKKFIIELRYEGEESVRSEALRPERQDENFTLLVGRHSGRLHAIEIDVNQLKAQSVQVQMYAPKIAEKVQRALSHFARRSPWQRRADNYRVAGEVISKKHQELFGSLAAAG